MHLTVFLNLSKRYLVKSTEMMICNVKIPNGISAFKDKIVGDRYTI